MCLPKKSNSSQTQQQKYSDEEKVIEYSLPAQYRSHFVVVLIAQLCPTLCACMDCSPPGSSVYGILQTRILEWVAMPFSRQVILSKDYYFYFKCYPIKGTNLVLTRRIEIRPLKVLKTLIKKEHFRQLTFEGLYKCPQIFQLT